MIDCKIKELRELIHKWNYEYYTLDDPSVSDEVYDKTLNELILLEEQNPHLKTEDSPTVKVGASDLRKSKFTKVKHKVPMLSLNNSYDEKDICDFINRVHKSVPNEEALKFILEPKLDGLSISIHYIGGKLFKAITRGDGVTGEDVTENILQITSIPKYLKEPVTIEVRGEVVLPIENFNKLNEKLKQDNRQLFANPRNAASGTLRQIDSNVVKERGLDCYLYYVVEPLKHGLTSHKQCLEYIRQLGLPITGINYEFRTSEEFMELMNMMSEKKKTLPYETDGLVIKTDNVELWNEIGYTSKSPRWAIAYKFPTAVVSTKLKAVTWQVGRTGKLTPVAELECVNICGTNVERATLHNMDEINRKDIRVGDTVYVTKAAEIIPQVVGPVEQLRNGSEFKIEEPLFCPECNHPIVKYEGVVDLFCQNPNCPAIMKGKLLHFVSKYAMDIVGIGDAFVDFVVDHGLVNTLPDLYNLLDKDSKLYQSVLVDLGELVTNKIIASMIASKSKPFKNVLYGIGIPSVGKHIASILATEFGSIERLMNANISDFRDCGVGTVVANAVVSLLRTDYFKDIIGRLKDVGLCFEEVSLGGSLANMQICITGKFENVSRHELENIIWENGGRSVSYSKNIDFLLVGENAGSKLTKARKNGIRTVDIEEFLAMIN